MFSPFSFIMITDSFGLISAIFISCVGCCFLHPIFLFHSSLICDKHIFISFPRISTRGKRFMPYTFEIVFIPRSHLIQLRIEFLIINRLLLQIRKHCFIAFQVLLLLRGQKLFQFQIFGCDVSALETCRIFSLFLSDLRSHNVPWCGLCSCIIWGARLVLSFQKHVSAYWGKSS